MRRLYLLLIILNIISILFISQIVLDIIPLFPSIFNIDKSEKINSLIVDLSIGIITSTFFYYLLVYIPEKRKKKIVRNMIRQNLIRVANGMNHTIAYLADLCNIHSNSSIYDDIDPKSFKRTFDSINVHDKGIYLRTNLNTSVFPNCIDKISLESMCNESFSKIEENIDNIFKNPTIIFENQLLVDALSNIKNSGFIYVLKADINGNHNLQSLYEAENFYQSYLSLLKFVTPSPIFFRKATQEDIKKYRY